MIQAPFVSEESKFVVSHLPIENCPIFLLKSSSSALILPADDISQILFLKNLVIFVSIAKT
jgi:hypothetical protein